MLPLGIIQPTGATHDFKKLTSTLEGPSRIEILQGIKEKKKCNFFFYTKVDNLCKMVSEFLFCYSKIKYETFCDSFQLQYLFFNVYKSCFSITHSKYERLVQPKGVFI